MRRWELCSQTSQFASLLSLGLYGVDYNSIMSGLLLTICDVRFEAKLLFVQPAEHIFRKCIFLHLYAQVLVFNTFNALKLPTMRM